MIREANVNDSLNISKLIISGWQTAYRGLIPDENLDNMSIEKTNERWKDLLMNKTSTEFVCLYEENNKILGVIRFGNPIDNTEKYTAEIHALYVEPSLKRRGIGSKLFKYATDYFVSVSKTNMIIWCLKGNEPSIKFYEKMGGKIVETRKANVHDIDLEEVGLEYSLGLNLREYIPSDADEIVSWIKDERDLKLWSADRYTSFPIKPEDINKNYEDSIKSGNFYPMTLVDNNKMIGHIILRNPISQKRDLFRLGFIIINPNMRKKGYGKVLINETIKYAKGVLNAKEITLGVFENNLPAYNLYKAVGFKEIETQENSFQYKNEMWNLVEMIL